jgi:competence protein ComEC
MGGIIFTAWGRQLANGWLAAALALLGAAQVLLWWRGRPARLLPLVWFWLLGVALGQQGGHPVLPPHHVVHLPQEQALNLQGHLYRSGKAGPGRAQLFVQAEAWLSPQGWRPATGRLLLVVPAQELPAAGTALVVKGRLGAPRTLKNPGTFDRTRYLAADGIFREMRLRDPAAVVWLAGSEFYPLGERLRGGIRQLLRDLDPNCRAIYLAMLLGDQGEITPEMRAAFARTGTSHLLVINGLHLGMVAAVVFFLSFWLLRRFTWLLLRFNVAKVATLLAALAVVAYAWVAGGSPSTQRAEVMVLAYLLLVFLGRPREVWSALALAALVILCLAPLRLFAISFQLSFAAVAALIYFAPRLPQKPWQEYEPPGLGPRLWFWAKESLLVSAVATVATAPLVAAYFQVVSLLGVLVNLAAIPLVLGLALPLGEAAVLAQSLSMTPVAQGLLFLGKFPLWLGFRAIDLGSRVPGSAIIVPIPTWWQIGLCYLLLLLLFARRRNVLTWGGAALAGLVLAATVAAPLARPPQALEVTCLDSFGGLHGVVVTPEGRRLAFSAPGLAWRQSGGGAGPLPGYCHWRQFRGLELAVAFTLSRDNAGELLTLARQFTIGEFWYGRRGREGPGYWELWNFLGDRGQLPRSLERGQPPPRLGSVDLGFVPLGEDRGFALQLAYQGRRVLLLPPAKALEADSLPAAGSPWHLLVLPLDLAGGQDGEALLRRLRPEQVVAYGGRPGRPAPAGRQLGVPCQVTGEGAVSVYLAQGGITVRQWPGRP